MLRAHASDHRSGLRSGLLGLAVLVGVFAHGTAQAAPQWHDGVAKYAHAINCPSQIFGNPYVEPEAAAWAGTYIDVNDLPNAGEVFYIRIAAAGIGNPCGGMYANFELVLHPDMRLAIGGDFPVICAALPAGANQWSRESNCPQQPGQGLFGRTFNPPSQGAWPLPPGAMWQVQIPVYATKRLVGAAGNGLFCGDCIVAPVQIIDGTSSGYLDPQQWINVDEAEPAAGFPTPFAAFDPAARTATTTAYQYNYFVAGDAVALLTEDVNGNGQLDPTEQPAGQTAFVAANAADYAIRLDHTWSNLKPNTRYFYELGFFPGGYGPGKTALVSEPKNFVTPNWPGPVGGVSVNGGGSGSGSPPPSGAVQPPPSQPPPPADASTGKRIDTLREGGGPIRFVPGVKQDAAPPPAPDTKKPSGKLTVTGSQKLRALLKGLRFRLTCSEAATARAVLRVPAKTARVLKLESIRGKPVTIATAEAACAADRTASITLKPRPAIAARLRKARKPWRGTLALTITDAAGNRGATSTRLTFKR